MPRLGVNVDHVATLRQQRGGRLPDPVWAARVAERVGCDGIVCHLREDRRHIQEADLRALKAAVRTALNLEMAADPQIVRIACRVRPHQATLVPERRRELTTEGGLNLRKNRAGLTRAIRRLREAGILVSLFIDPDPAAVREAARLGVPMVELHTGRYAESRRAPERSARLRALREAVRVGRQEGLRMAAGHGLDYRNVSPVARVAGIEELNIGFSIVARAVEIGWERAVREMAARVHGRAG